MATKGKALVKDLGMARTRDMVMIRAWKAEIAEATLAEVEEEEETGDHTLVNVKPSLAFA